MVSVLVPGVCLAQLSAGTITGVVRDASGGVIAGAPVQAVHGATGQVRMTITPDRGEYSFPALLPGEYEISVAVVGFQRIARAATVEAGTTTRADFVLRVGDLSATETFGFDGLADGTVTGSEIRAAMNGDLVYWNARTFAPAWYCRATNHVVILRR